MRDDPELLDAALALVAQEGYAQFTLAKFAKKTGRPLADIYRHFPSRVGILDALSRRIDERLRGMVHVELDMPPRDRLFDVIMTRIELYEPYRSPLLVYAREIAMVPRDAVLTIPVVVRLNETVLALAGIETSGLKGRLRLQTMMAVHGRILQTWLFDEDPGLSRTMAQLDRLLRLPEQLDPTFWGEMPQASAKPPDAAPSS